MPSLDFIRDIGDTLKLQGIEYLIISVQRGKKANRVDFFHFIKDKEGVLTLEEALKRVQEDIQKLKEKYK
jgi:hypothetical protein